MKKLAMLLALVVFLSFGPELAYGTIPTLKQTRKPATSETTTQTHSFKATPADASGNSSQSPDKTFRVNDVKGLLLTCTAPQIDTNPDTDIFNNCALAPGRTLDDVMHSFVQTIHFVQNQELKEAAKREGDHDHRPAQK